MIGRTVSHYRILEKLGGGGMGLVYRAQDTRLDRTVALKFLPMEWSQEPVLRERFSREARAASALDHPHICTVFDIDETPEGQLFIAMAYCPGETLRQRIFRGPLSVDAAVDLAIQIGEALEAAHEQGIVHRDVKPGNILMTGHDQVKVVDFGLAKLAGEVAVTREGAVVGTPAYMSPEQAVGDNVDGRADLWALGAVLYEMLSGRRPFAADNERAMLMAIQSLDPTPVTTLRPEVPEELHRIVRRCLTREPGDRYQNAGELLADLHRFRGDETPSEILTQSLPSAPRVRLKAATTRRVVPLGAVIVAIVVAAIFYPVIRSPRTRHVVVLPFSCHAEDDQASHLCEGLVDTITTKLSELRQFRTSLSVVPASEVRMLKGAGADGARKVFGVDLAVTGSVQRAGNNLRILLQLVDAARLRQVRSHTITTEQTPDFVLQDRVVEAIEEMLDLELGAAERRAMMAGGTSQAEAAELYLEGRGSIGEEPSESELTRAIELFRRALEIDPNYTDALVQLASVCHLQFQHREDPIWLDHGLTYARRALDVDPNLPAAHYAAGRCEFARGDHAEAINRLERVIGLDPLRLDAYTTLAVAYETTGDVERAEATIDRAVRTGPDDWQTYYTIGRFYYKERRDYERAAGYFRRVVEVLPESSIGYGALGGCLLYLGDLEGTRVQLERAVEIGGYYWVFNNLATLEFYEQDCGRAAELYQRTLDIDDSDYRVWNNLAEAHRCAGDLESAHAAFARAAALLEPLLAAHPGDLNMMLDLASFRLHAGNEDAARDLVPRILALGVTKARSMYYLAALYEDLGERENALEWIGRALEGGYPLHMIEGYAGFDELRQDPRFVDLTATYTAQASDGDAGGSKEKGGR
jgi:serine/threonine-protein kinase